MLHDATATRSSSWTMTSACFHARTTLAKSTRRIRSAFVQTGRFTWRLSMISCCPMNNAGPPFVHIRNREPLETRKNLNELLLQEDTLLFLLQCKYLFTPSNITSAACLFATSEGRLFRSDDGFF